MRNDEFDITKRLTNLQRDIESFKSTQFVGSDNTGMILVQSANAYDLTATIPAYSGGVQGYKECRGILNVNSASIPEWIYDNVFAEIWIDNLSNPFVPGNDASNQAKLKVFLVDNLNAISLQINNFEAASHTLYVKFYALSTAPGTITSFWTV